MSRTLAIALLTLAVGVGCAATPSSVVKPEPDVVLYSGVQQWLELHQDVSSMSNEAVAEILANAPVSQGVNELYYYALLQQQLQNYPAWVLARDAFRVLHADEDLTVAQRQLAKVLQAYNQNRINWYQRHSELLKEQASLQQQLQNAERDKLLLEKKIQALTDLQAVISTRKED